MKRRILLVLLLFVCVAMSDPCNFYYKKVQTACYDYNIAYDMYNNSGSISDFKALLRVEARMVMYEDLWTDCMERYY